MQSDDYVECMEERQRRMDFCKDNGRKLSAEEEKNFFHKCLSLGINIHEFVKRGGKLVKDVLTKGLAEDYLETIYEQCEGE